MWILELILNLFNFNSNDPVKSCKVYKRHGCSHIDGYLCNIKNCNILEKYELQELEQQLDISLKDRIK